MIIEIIMYTFFILVIFAMLLSSFYNDYKLPKRRRLKILIMVIGFLVISWTVFYIVTNHHRISSASWIIFCFFFILAAISITRAVIIRIKRHNRTERH